MMVLFIGLGKGGRGYFYEDICLNDYFFEEYKIMI